MFGVLGPMLVTEFRGYWIAVSGPRRGGIGLAVIWAAACLSCGGGGETPGDIVGPPPEPRGGRILVDNQTRFALEVAFLNEVDQKAPAIVRTTVEAGKRQDVSRALLPGGMKVELDLVLLVAEGEGFRVRRKAQVTVDGEAVVTVQLTDSEDPFSVVVE